MNKIAEQRANVEHGVLVIKRVMLPIVILLALSSGVFVAQAQEAVQLEMKIIELGATDYVRTQNKGRSQIMMITSDNPNVATARRHETNSIEIISHAVGG